MLDNLSSNRRQYCASAAAAPYHSSNGWFTQELVYRVH
jgi:hypothetical protein